MDAFAMLKTPIGQKVFRELVIEALETDKALDLTLDMQQLIYRAQANQSTAVFSFVMLAWKTTEERFPERTLLERKDFLSFALTIILDRIVEAEMRPRT